MPTEREIKNAIEEIKKTIYGCSVVLSKKDILNFYGNKEEIKAKLKFIKGSLFEIEPIEDIYDKEEEYLKLPVILTEQDDVSGVRIFYLRDFEENI